MQSKAGNDPRRIRALFSLLIMEGAPALELYGIHKDFMAKDFRYNRTRQRNEDDATNEVLKELSLRLEGCGKTLTRYNLPEPRLDVTEMHRELNRHKPDNCSANYKTQLNLANNEQRRVLEQIFENLNSGAGGLFYLDGPPGRGKTFTLTTAVNYVRGQGQVALCCATTGFVAVMYPGGRTAHNLFNISVNDDPADMTPIQCDVGPNTGRAELLRSAKLIIWDEFTMTNRENFEAVDTMLRGVRNVNRSMGGILFVGAGDFRQIPPVIQYGTKEDIISASIRYSSLWKEFRSLQLAVPVRQQNDPGYAT